MARTKDDALHKQRQQQILHAAKHCFVENGFHQSSMRQILKQSGISAGAAYNYFSSKSEIVKGLVEEELADVNYLENKLHSAKNPLIGIAQMIYTIIRHTKYEDAVLASEIHAESCRNPEIAKVTARINKKLESLINDAIVEGREQGCITTKHKSKELTDWVIALYEGYVGKIAVDKKFKHKVNAKVAERAVLVFLAFEP